MDHAIQSLIPEEAFAVLRAEQNKQQLTWTQAVHPHTTNASNTKQQIGSVLHAHREDVSLSFISLRRMEGLIVLHDKGSLIMVSIRQIRSNTSVSLAIS